MDTDSFGTFSGERPRSMGVRETLEGKVKLACELYPNRRLFLASEGSFAPHPEFPWIMANHEVLFFFDREKDLKLFADSLSIETVAISKEIHESTRIEDVLKEASFPEHALIIRSGADEKMIFKGIKSKDELEKALKTCLNKGPIVFVQNDLRSHMNPTRQKVIFSAGERLLEKLTSLCQSCGSPGFSVSETISGLPCQACGRASRFPEFMIFSCPSCGHKVKRPRLDGKKEIDPGECDFCNP